VDKDDLELFRDHVLVPSLTELLARPKPDVAASEALIALVAMTPDPTDGPALAAWKAMMTAMQKAGDHYDKTFAKHRLAVKHERGSPPPMVKKSSFCGIAETAEPTAND
jgi:hypothetical protein